jgi:ADP-L-glycero-D-manno-heptose 6-epimerase
MRIVVTGGLGFIGTSVVRRLLGMNHEVIVVDYAEQLIKDYEKNGLPILKEIYCSLKDCLDVMEPYEFLGRDVNASVYIHLGACVDTRGVPTDLFEKNIRYVRALAESLPYESRVVYASSAAVYGTDGFPCNAYGMSKKLGENILRSQLRLRTTALRFFNVYGGNEHHKGDMASVPFKIARAYRTKDRFNLFCPDASRDFISVDDVTDAVVGHALEKTEGAAQWGVFDVGTGKNTTFEDLDYSLRVLFNRQESICDQVEMPSSLTGRYQSHTRAGSRATVKISPYVTTKQDIRDSLKEQFIVEN